MMKDMHIWSKFDGISWSAANVDFKHNSHHRKNQAPICKFYKNEMPWYRSEYVYEYELKSSGTYLFDKVVFWSNLVP